jgi:drug/metabolite transporter (DMT)-like permease
VIAKHLLRRLATLTVMTARMTIGTAMLFAYVIAIGHLGAAAHLSATQWGFVIATGCILLLFTVTTFTAIRHASVSAVLAIGTAAPIITTLLQVTATGTIKLDLGSIAGLAVTLLAVLVVIAIGVRQDNRAVRMDTAA